MNNYAINSNNDSIRDDDGRRYFICDVSHKYKDNHDYFDKLRKECFNDAVGEAFYNYMIEVDTNDFYPQKYPMTKNKLISHIKRLPKEYEFIKQNYILKNLGINCTPKVLYSEYKEFCSKPIVKGEFMTKLSNVGICDRKTNGNNYYKYSFEELKKIGEEKHWLHETDDYEDVNEQDDNNIIEEKDNIIENLKLEIESLKKQLTEFYSLFNKSQEVQEIISDEEEDLFDSF